MRGNSVNFIDIKEFENIKPKTIMQTFEEYWEYEKKLKKEEAIEKYKNKFS